LLLAQGLGQLQQAARGFRDGVAAGDRNSQLVAPSSSVILHMMHFTLYFSLLRNQLISKKKFFRTPSLLSSMAREYLRQEKTNSALGDLASILSLLRIQPYLPGSD